jgi:hypothetical protein
MEMNRANIDVHIGELVLRGPEPADGKGVGRALTRELSRLIAERGVPAQWTRSRDVSRPAAADANIGSGARPKALGIQVAHVVYEGRAR